MRISNTFFSSSYEAFPSYFISTTVISQPRGAKVHGSIPGGGVIARSGDSDNEVAAWAGAHRIVRVGRPIGVVLGVFHEQALVGYGDELEGDAGAVRA